MAEQQEENRPESFSFEGHDVFLLNNLITYDKAFFIGCTRPRKTILKKNIPEDQYWFASFSERTQQWSRSIPENKKAKILISEEWVHNNLPKFTGKAKEEVIENLKRELAEIKEREQRYKEREQGYLEREQEYQERERGYKCEINSLEQDNKNCQDALRKIALLSSEDHMKLKKNFEKTRRILEPLLNE